MRTAFFESLIECAKINPDLMLLVGDLGFGVTKDFCRHFPNQFLNVGVAEQNMTGLAAGMALAGKTCITYSIGNFSTLRCLEQIRNDVCYHNLNVKIVSVGGGVAYGAVGSTHHATEDLAIMRALPGIKVYCPGDPAEAYGTTQIMLNEEGPCYLRLGRAGEMPVHQSKPILESGKITGIKAGETIAVLATGGMLATASKAVTLLEKEGFNPGFYSVPFIKPMHQDSICKLLKKYRLVITAEDHSVIGGLGSAISDIVTENNLQANLLKIGLPSEFSKVVGDQAYIHKYYSLTAEAIYKKIKKEFKEIV